MRNPADAFSKYSNYFKNFCASFFCLFYLSTVNLDRIMFMKSVIAHLASNGLSL